MGARAPSCVVIGRAISSRGATKVRRALIQLVVAAVVAVPGAALATEPVPDGPRYGTESCYVWLPLVVIDVSTQYPYVQASVTGPGPYVHCPR